MKIFWGYGLDDEWPEKDLPISNLNIILSPHIGSDTDFGNESMRVMSVEAVNDYIHGNSPKNIVNKR